MPETSMEFKIKIFVRKFYLYLCCFLLIDKTISIIPEHENYKAQNLVILTFISSRFIFHKYDENWSLATYYGCV